MQQGKGTRRIVELDPVVTRVLHMYSSHDISKYHMEIIIYLSLLTQRGTNKEFHRSVRAKSTSTFAYQAQGTFVRPIRPCFLLKPMSSI